MPTPGYGTLKYGGNTTCLELGWAEAPGLTEQTAWVKANQTPLPGNLPPCFIIDAGSGIAPCGDTALERGVREFHILLSHMHYDHIIGLTKFTPLFRGDCSIHFYGQAKKGKSLRLIVSKIFSFPYFPVEFRELKSQMSFTEINDVSELVICDHLVEFQALNHPQEAVAFRVWDSQRAHSLVFATDHEHGTQKDKHLAKFAHKAELFVCDATYSEEAYGRAVGWGHATAAAGARIAKSAHVGKFGICHHDPLSTDEHLEHKILPEAQVIFPASFLCREGDIITLV